MTPKLVAFLILVFTSLASAGTTIKDIESIRDLSKLKDSIIFKMWEGLPHQNWEHEQLMKELLEKDTFEFQGYNFYKELLELEEYDIDSLKHLLKKPEHYEPIVLGRFCGSFHPDYYIEFVSEGKKYEVLVCLGCGEIWTIHEGIVSKIYITNEAHKKFKTEFKPHRKNRPLTKI